MLAEYANSFISLWLSSSKEYIRSYLLHTAMLAEYANSFISLWLSSSKEYIIKVVMQLFVPTVSLSFVMPGFPNA